VASTAILLVDIIGSKELAAQPGGHSTIQNLCQDMQTFLDTKFKALAHDQDFTITLEPAKGDDIRYRLEGNSLRVIADLSLSAVIAAFDSSPSGKRFRYVIYKVEADKTYQPLIGAFDELTKTPEGKQHHIAVERSIQSALSAPTVIEWLKGAAHLVHILPFKGESATGVHVDLYCTVLKPVPNSFSINEYPGRETIANAYLNPEHKAEDVHKKNGKHLTTLPYVGLNCVRLERHEYFGGRDYEIDELVGRVRRGQRFLVIYGISGVGKSSLLAAGLLGRLNYKDAIPAASRHWEYLFVRPKDEPLEQLASKIIDKYGSLFLYDSDHLAQQLKKSPTAFQDIAATILADKPDSAELVVAVDQMEELFTRADTEQKKSEAAAFLQMLVRASENLPVRVLGTIRDDYFRELSRHDFLIEQLNKEGIYCLKPLDSTGLYQAILKPLEHANWSIEQGLAQRIVEDAGMNPGALPMVALCMERLQSMARERGTPHINRGDYDALGGLQGVIRVLVHEVYEEIGGEAREDLFHRLFFHLVQLDNGKEVRRQISRSALRDEPMLEKLVDELINKRLLTGGEENAIEISHDRLFEIWDLLRNWIEKNRELLKQLREVEERWAKCMAVLESKIDGEKIKDDIDKEIVAERWLLDDKDRIKELRLLLDAHNAYIPNREKIDHFLKGSEELIERINLAKTIQSGMASEISNLLKKNIKLEPADKRSGRIDPVFYAAITGDDKIDPSREASKRRPSKRDYREIAGSILNSENIRSTTKETYTPLHLAAISGQREVARKILHLGVSPDIETREGGTPLMFALAYDPGDEMTSLLLAYGANPKHLSNLKWRPLLAAAFGGKLKYLRELRAFDEDIISPEDEGWSALTLAAQGGYEELAQYLINQGADVEAKTKHGYTPLLISAVRGHSGVLEVLLKHTNAREVGPDRISALMLAAENGHAEATSKLAHVSNLDAQDAQDRTALMRVIISDNLNVEKKFEICKILLEAGADVSVLDNSGQTAVNYAKQRDYTTLADWLRSQLPQTWHLDAGDQRRQEIRGRLNNSIAWPVSPYINAGWVDVSESEAVDVLCRVTEIELAADKAPVALVQTIRRLRSAGLACLPNWRIYEALVEARAQNALALLTFLTNGDELEILATGQDLIGRLFEKKAVVLESTQAIEDYARLFCAYVHYRRGPGRLIEFPEQLSWDDESDRSDALPLAISGLQIEPDATNKQIIVRGTFLLDQDLIKGRMIIPSSVDGEALSLRRFRGRHSIDETEKIAGPLPIRNETPWNVLRMVGARIEDERTSSGNTIFEAVQQGDLAVVERLIAEGRINKGVFAGQELLITAIEFERPQVAWRLLEAGVDVDERSYNGRTALHCAALKGDEESVRLLLTSSSPANINPHDDEGQTPLMLAVAAGHVGVVKLLLDNGGHLEREDNQGKTALFFAVEAGNEEIVNLLIPKCKVQQKSDNGDTLLSVCVDSKSEKRSIIFNTLIAAGAAPADLKYIPSSLLPPDEVTSKVIDRAIEHYRDDQINFAWPRLPKLHEDWRLMPKTEAAAIASRFDEWQVAAEAERLFNKSLILEVRSVDLPFYQDWKLVEMLLQHVYQHRTTVLSFLMAKSEEGYSMRDEAEKIVLLGGTSVPIHELNGRLPIKLENDFATLAYLRFFCSYVWGEEGGFWIIDDSGVLPWTTNADNDTRALVDKVIKLPRLLESEEQGRMLTATILYARHIFEARFMIAPTGMIEMLEDDPLTPKDLPLLPDERHGIHRIVKSAHVQ
jgi:ankyrin repeat protein